MTAIAVGVVVSAAGPSSTLADLRNAMTAGPPLVTAAMTWAAANVAPASSPEPTPRWTLLLTSAIAIGSKQALRRGRNGARESSSDRIRPEEPDVGYVAGRRRGVVRRSDQPGSSEELG